MRRWEGRKGEGNGGKGSGGEWRGVKGRAGKRKGGEGRGRKPLGRGGGREGKGRRGAKGEEEGEGGEGELASPTHYFQLKSCTGYVSKINVNLAVVIVYYRPKLQTLTRGRKQYIFLYSASCYSMQTNPSAPMSCSG